MTDVKEYGVIRNNKFIFYVLLPIIMIIYDFSSTSWHEIDFVGIIVSLTVVLIIMTGLDWLLVKWEIWLDKKLEERRLKKSK